MSPCTCTPCPVCLELVDVPNLDKIAKTKADWRDVALQLQTRAHRLQELLHRTQGHHARQDSSGDHQ